MSQFIKFYFTTSVQERWPYPHGDKRNYNPLATYGARNDAVGTADHTSLTACDQLTVSSKGHGQLTVSSKGRDQLTVSSKGRDQLTVSSKGRDELTVRSKGRNQLTVS